MYLSYKHLNVPHISHPQGLLGRRPQRGTVRAHAVFDQTPASNHALVLKVLDRFPQGIAVLSSQDLTNLKYAAEHNRGAHLTKPHNSMNYLPFIEVSQDEVKALVLECEKAPLDPSTIAVRKTVLVGDIPPHHIRDFAEQYSLGTHSLAASIYTKVAQPSDILCQDLTPEYHQAKRILVRHLANRIDAQAFIQLANSSRSPQVRQTLALLACQHIKITFDTFARYAPYQSLMSPNPTKEEEKETAYFIRQAVIEKQEKLLATKQGSNAPTLWEFIDQARPSLIPKTFNFELQSTYPGALYLTRQTNATWTNSLIHNLKVIAPHLDFSSEAVELWLHEVTQMPIGESFSLADATEQELRQFLNQFLNSNAINSLKRLRTHSSILLLQNTTPSNQHFHENSCFNKLNKREHHQATVSIRNFITNEIFRLFQEIPDNEIAPIIRATPGALALLHAMFCALGKGGITNERAFEREFNTLAERYLFR